MKTSLTLSGVRILRSYQVTFEFDPVYHKLQHCHLWASALLLSRDGIQVTRPYFGISAER